MALCSAQATSLGFFPAGVDPATPGHVWPAPVSGCSKSAKLRGNAAECADYKKRKGENSTLKQQWLARSRSSPSSSRPRGLVAHTLSRYSGISRELCELATLARIKLAAPIAPLHAFLFFPLTSASTPDSIPHPLKNFFFLGNRNLALYCRDRENILADKISSSFYTKYIGWLC